MSVARLRHLVVDLAQRRRHFVGQRAGDDHDVGLPWRGAWRKAEALGVVARIDICIISTAQQASPNVIHIKEPVRAQMIRSSVAVTTKPLSARSLLRPAK
jgi:hypothetical protein